jgi:hypothetical protein
MNCLCCLSCIKSIDHENINKEKKDLPNEIACKVIRVISCNHVIISCYSNSEDDNIFYNVKLTNVNPIVNNKSEGIRALISFILNKDVIIQNISKNNSNEIYGDIIYDNINVNAWLIYNNLATYENK